MNALCGAGESRSGSFPLTQTARDLQTKAKTEAAPYAVELQHRRAGLWLFTYIALLLFGLATLHLLAQFFLLLQLARHFLSALLIAFERLATSHYRCSFRFACESARHNSRELIRAET